MKPANLSIFFSGIVLLLFCFSNTSASEVRQWNFEVFLDKKPVGFHTFTLTEDDGRDVMSTEANFDVKILFVTAFKYRHDNTEIWEDGCLVSMDASTNNNGEELNVIGSAVDKVFTVNNTNKTQNLSGCVRSFAYWDRQFLTSNRLLNSQTGEYEQVTINLDGNEEINIAGKPTRTNRYRLTAATGDIQLWYGAEDDVWLGLEAPVKGGRKLRYILSLSEPASQ